MCKIYTIFSIKGEGLKMLMRIHIDHFHNHKKSQSFVRFRKMFWTKYPLWLMYSNILYVANISFKLQCVNMQICISIYWATSLNPLYDIYHLGIAKDTRDSHVLCPSTMLFYTQSRLPVIWSSIAIQCRPQIIYMTITLSWRASIARNP